MPNVLVPTPRGQMPAYLVVPSAPGPAPGVVVLHDVSGMSRDLRSQSDWLHEPSPRLFFVKDSARQEHRLQRRRYSGRPPPHHRLLPRT